MWLATRELLLEGWVTDAYPRKTGGRKPVLDADAAWRFAIDTYIEALGPKFDLTRFRTYMNAEEFRKSHWLGRGALNFSDQDTRRNFKRRGLRTEKELYNAANMHGLVLHEDQSIFTSVKGQPPLPPPLLLCPDSRPLAGARK